MSQDPERLPVRWQVLGWALWLVSWLIVVMLFATGAAVIVGPFIDPRVYPYTRFLRFLFCCIAAVLLIRHWVPHAWHYRRDDKGGMAFVLFCLVIVVWNAVMLLTGADME